VVGRTGRESLQAADRGACARVCVGAGDGDIRINDSGRTRGSDGEPGKKRNCLAVLYEV